jgi:hypothetical protein
MAVNYNDRTGVLGIDLTPQFNNSFQTAGFCIWKKWKKKH